MTLTRASVSMDAELKELEKRCEDLKKQGSCQLSRESVNPILTSLHYFREEYEHHVQNKYCHALVCPKLLPAPCHLACPAGIDIPSFLALIAEGRHQEAWASGEEVIHHLVERLQSAGITLIFSGLKKQVLDVMRATGLFDAIGQGKLFATEDQAIACTIYEQLGENAADDLFCAIKSAACCSKFSGRAPDGRGETGTIGLQTK